MQKLIGYHTVQADPRHFWTNVKVGSDLELCKLETYEEYEKCCSLHGVSPYNEDTFNEYKEQHYNKHAEFYKNKRKKDSK